MMRDYDDYDDGCDFADPGGRSALRAASGGLVMRDRNLVLLNEFSGYLDDMNDGDVILISKRPQGGKWTITTISGDGYAVTGFGLTFEEAWNHEV